MTDAPESSVGIGVLGGNAFIANAAVLPALAAARGAHLSAIASRSGEVPSRWADRAVPDYDDVLDHPDTDAVYLALPNGLHRTWTERAAAAGVAVLCEKPLAPTGDDAVAMAEACADAGVLLAEAWMTPFGTRWQALRASLDGADITTIDARFTFRIGPEAATNYRWRRDQGGGALLDVGIYTTGLAAELLGAGELEVVSSRAGADDRHGDGVDAWSRAELRSPSGAGAAELLGIPEHMTQAALLPVAYTVGTDFKPAARPPVQEITYLDTYKNPIA